MRTRIAFLFVLLVSVTGCSEVAGPEGQGIHGTWVLETINLAGLPFALIDDDIEKVEVMSGRIDLRVDGTFTDEMGYRLTPAGGAAEPFGETLTGRFYQDRELGAIFFEIEGGGAYDVEVGEGTLTQLVGGYELVYVR
jgi:hypothetical protein